MDRRPPPHPRSSPPRGESRDRVARTAEIRAMPIINRIADFHGEMTEWRQRIHAHPETAFEEHDTAELVAEAPRILRHLGRSRCRANGVIGTPQGDLYRATGAVALRADMDASHIAEQNDFPACLAQSGPHACLWSRWPHRNAAGCRQTPGGDAKFCRDDLLHLSARRGKRRRGAIDDRRGGSGEVSGRRRLWDAQSGRDCRSDSFAIQPGPMMAAFDIFEIEIKGRGAHACNAASRGRSDCRRGASRERSADDHQPQRAPARSVPSSASPRSMAATTWNVIPETVGAARHDPRVQPGGARSTEPAIRRIANGVCKRMRGPKCSCATSGATRRRSIPRQKPRLPLPRRHRSSAITMSSAIMLPSMAAEDFRLLLEKARRLYLDRQRGCGERRNAAQSAL